MTYLGNTPGSAVLLRVEARKSFSLAVWIKDHRGKAADLTGCQMTIVAKPYPMDNESDVTNLLAPNQIASIPVPKLGYAKFDIQAQTLDFTPGEYDYAIVLRTAENYSSVIVKGTLELIENPEHDSVNAQYVSVNPTQTLNVLLQGANSVNVFVGGQLPPGMNYVRDEIMEAIESFDPDAVALVPPGGAPGYVLTKNSSDDYAMTWLPLGQGAFALDATGQPAGHVPAAVGDDTWVWAAVGIDATGVTAGWAPVADGAGGWDWAQVTFEQTKPDWNAPADDPAEILNKPDLGTAASHDHEDYYASTTLVSEMEGVHLVTAVPTTGTDGHLYFVYEP